MNFRISLSVVIAMLVGLPAAMAAPITGSTAVGSASSGSVTALALDHDGGAPFMYVPPTLADPGVGAIDISMTSTRLLHDSDPVLADFTTSPDVGPPGFLLGFVPSFYKFNVTLTNANLQGKSIQQVDFTLAGAATFLDPSATPTVPVFGPNPTPGGNGDFVGGLHIINGQHIRFGGLNGGGGGLVSGGTTTLSFFVSVPGSGAGGLAGFSLGMVANPEPASLALGGLALAGFGGFVSRRRKKKLEIVTEEQTVA